MGGDSSEVKMAILNIQLFAPMGPNCLALFRVDGTDRDGKLKSEFVDDQGNIYAGIPPKDAFGIWQETNTLKGWVSYPAQGRLPDKPNDVKIVTEYMPRKTG
jgi:hypothetical protein